MACPSGPADFRQLAEKAYPEDGSKDRNALEKLWKELFKLPQWHLVATQQTLAEGRPSIETVAGERCVLVYTDLGMLRGYALSRSQPEATDAGSADDAGPTLINFNVPSMNPDGGSIPASPYFGVDGAPVALTLTPDAARAMFAAPGIPPDCIRFNEGTRRGWFAPVKAIESIHGMLKGSGKI